MDFLLPSSAISQIGITGNSFDRMVMMISTSSIEARVTADSISVGL
jgi:hypothetical protein